MRQEGVRKVSGLDLQVPTDRPDRAHLLQPITKGQAVKIHRLLMVFLVVCAIPFRVLDSPHFHAFVQQLRPSYELPGI
jgi:hypothetical protein